MQFFVAILLVFVLAVPSMGEVPKDIKLEKVGHPLVKVTTPKGEIFLELFPEIAPKHVTSFLSLIKKGFYKGLTFHRVVPKFVIQGGCPKGDGTGGPGYTVDGEFSSRPHLKGTLAMARSSDPNSAGSQFYICLETIPHLDNKYTVFGQVVKGHEIPEKITMGDTMDITILQDLPAQEK